MNTTTCDKKSTCGKTSTTIYARIAIVLLALNFAVNAYFIFSLLKMQEIGADARASAYERSTKTTTRK